MEVGLRVMATDEVQMYYKVLNDPQDVAMEKELK